MTTPKAPPTPKPQPEWLPSLQGQGSQASFGAQASLTPTGHQSPGRLTEDSGRAPWEAGVSGSHSRIQGKARLGGSWLMERREEKVGAAAQGWAHGWCTGLQDPPSCSLAPLGSAHDSLHPPPPPHAGPPCSPPENREGMCGPGSPGAILPPRLPAL